MKIFRVILNQLGHIYLIHECIRHYLIPNGIIYANRVQYEGINFACTLYKV